MESRLSEYANLAIGQRWTVNSNSIEGSCWVYEVLALCCSQENESIPVAICGKCFNGVLIGHAMCFDLTTGFECIQDDYYLVDEIEQAAPYATLPHS